MAVGIVLFIVGLASGWVLLAGQASGPVLIAAMLGALVCLPAGWIGIRRAREQRQAPTRPALADLPPHTQAKVYRRLRSLTALGGGLLSVHTLYALYMLETGRSESEILWAPVGLLYQFFGFWAALLTPIGLTIFLFYALSTIVRDHERKAKSKESA